MSLLPPETTLAILASRKRGHVVQCVGLAKALGVEADMRPVDPRGLFDFLAPWGPPDPRDGRGAKNEPLREPYPDIAIASGRESVPYLRALKRRSRGRTFTVFVGDPRAWRSTFDLIVLPEHDRYRGANAIVHLTAAHPHDDATRENAARTPHPAVAALKPPRIALLIGGPSGNFRFEDKDNDVIVAIAQTILASGASLMISPSRRTPAALRQALNESLARHRNALDRLFLWDGAGDNPYLSMLALADGFVVTADSANMIGEAVATGRPVHVYTPAGNAGKFAHFLKRLQENGAIRPWSGRIEHWRYKPVDATPAIAAQIASRYAAFAARPR